MSTLFFGGVTRIRRFFFPSEKRTEHHERIRTLGVGHHVDHVSPPFSKERPYSGIYPHMF